MADDRAASGVVGAGRLRLAGLAPLAFLLVAFLAGCAESRGYRAAEGGGPGHSERQIEPGRWLLFYRGASRDTPQDVDLYILRRAAEITLQTGGDHFLVVDRAIRDEGRASPGVVFAAPWGGWRSRGGVFGGVSLTTATRARPVAQAEIVVREGPKPAEDPTAYDARAVQATLGGE